jgi:hypothetical protein
VCFCSTILRQALDDFDDVTRRKARPPKPAVNKKLGANSTLGGKCPYRTLFFVSVARSFFLSDLARRYERAGSEHWRQGTT